MKISPWHCCQVTKRSFNYFHPFSTSPEHLLPATKASAPGIIGAPVHALLYVRLSGACLGWKLLLLPGKLGGIDSRVTGSHPRSHGISCWVHRVVGICHRISQHLWVETWELGAVPSRTSSKLSWLAAIAKLQCNHAVLWTSMNLHLVDS